MNIKQYLLITLVALGCGCGQNSSTSSVKNTADTVIVDTAQTKTLIKDINKNSAATPIDIDTTGLSQAPVRILRTSMNIQSIDTVDNPEDNLHHEGHFKRFATIKIVYKNVSSKRIIGLQMKWLVVDKNGNPAPIDSNRAGIGMGYEGSLASIDLSDFSFGIGKTKTDEWQQDTRTGVKIKLACATRVQFYDNTTWSIGKNK